MGSVRLKRGIVSVIVVVQVTGGKMCLNAATVPQNGRAVREYMAPTPAKRVRFRANTSVVFVTMFSSKQLKVVTPLHGAVPPVPGCVLWSVGHSDWFPVGRGLIDGIYDVVPPVLVGTGLEDLLVEFKSS